MNMDYKNLLEQYNCNACLMSIELNPDKTYGNILVVDGNQLFKDDICSFTGHPFVENTPYYMSFPKDLNFEDFIYRSAFLHQNLHTYVNLYQIGLWLEIYLLPLKSDKENIGYCLYSYVITSQANEGSMSDINPSTSSTVLSTCIKLHGTENFLTAIKEVTSDIRIICDARRCCILTIDSENESCKLLGDANREDYNAPFLTDEESRKEFYKLILTWEATLAGSTCLIVKNEQDMQIIKERNPEWYESLSSYNVESLVLFPLKDNGTILGYIWATNFDIKNTVKIKETLELSAFFIAEEISNYQMLRRLEVLSTIDMLTGTLNRNAMNNRVTTFDPVKEGIKSIGVIFADLNGLKFINDKEGHFKGDQFLRKSADVLRSVFTDDELYRAGGDEYMVLVVNNTKEEFEAKVEKIREINKTENKNLFALGSCFDSDELNIRKALRIADEKMYEDKEEYYSEHPDLRYR